MADSLMPNFALELAILGDDRAGIERIPFTINSPALRCFEAAA